ncbi:MAG: DUF3471 domain-containing protein, partial [Panacibacter sp.]
KTIIIKNKIMKKITVLLSAFVFMASAFAQLENTKWKSTITIDGPVNVIFHFKKTTVDLYRIADNSLIESMSYTHNDTSFTLKKISGQSDCDDAIPGKYRYVLMPKTLLLKVITDNCGDRSSVIDKTQWSAWKDPVEVKVSDAVLKQYAGTYQMDAQHPIILTLENGILYAEGPNNQLPKSPLIPESNTQFFLRIAGIRWDFIKDTKGNVTTLISHEAKDYELKKVK